MVGAQGGMWKRVAGRDNAPAWVGHDASEQLPVYTRGNAGEVYPEVFTPLTFSVAAEAGERAMREAIVTSGLVTRSEVDAVPLTTALGSAYLNLSTLRLASARAPGGKATDADISFLGVSEPPPHRPVPNERNRRATLAGIRYLWKTVRRTELPELEEDKKKVDRFLAALQDPATASDEQLRTSVDDLMPLFAELFERHLIVSFAAGLTVTTLSAICEREFDDELLAVQLLAGLGDVDSAAPSQAMWQLSRVANASPTVTKMFDDGPDGLWGRLQTAAGADDDTVADFLDRFGDFTARFGSRGPNEWDTAFDTWETDPALALTLIDRMRAVADSEDPAVRQDALTEEAQQLREELSARLSGLSRRIFNRVVDAARLHSRSRERSKTTVIKAIHGARLQSKELDRRLVARSGGQQGDLWFLLDSELDSYMADPAAARDKIAERRAVHATLSERTPPFFFEGTQPPLEEWELRTSTRPELATGEKLTGLPGCPGVARGRARVVTDPGDPRGLQPGDVLVAPLTDPAWTPLFLAAQAVVVDVGAVMSHAVIVSRELGIPCVVSAADATKRITDGVMVEVDGPLGTVTVID
jgi:pyruvate,water dikinase